MTLLSRGSDAIGSEIPLLAGQAFYFLVDIGGPQSRRLPQRSFETFNVRPPSAERALVNRAFRRDAGPAAPGERLNRVELLLGARDRSRMAKSHYAAAPC